MTFELCRRYKLLVVIICLVSCLFCMLYVSPKAQAILPLIIPVSIEVVMALIILCGITYYADRDLYYMAADFIEHASTQILAGLNQVAGEAHLMINMTLFLMLRAAILGHFGIINLDVPKTDVLNVMGALTPAGFFSAGTASFISSMLPATGIFPLPVIHQGAEPLELQGDFRFNAQYFNNAKVVIAFATLGAVGGFSMTLTAEDGTIYNHFEAAQTAFDRFYDVVNRVQIGTVFVLSGGVNAAPYSTHSVYVYTPTRDNLGRTVYQQGQYIPMFSVLALGIVEPVDSVSWSYSPTIANEVVNTWNESISLDPATTNQSISIPETWDLVVPADILQDLDLSRAGEVEVPDVPIDVPIGEVGTLVGQIATTLGEIGNFFKHFFDPTVFALDVSGFKDLIITTRFPFCIPFDLINAVRVFAAAAADYSFDIDLDTAFFQLHHKVDLSPYKFYIGFFRYVVVIWFSWMLALKTRSVMKW